MTNTTHYNMTIAEGTDVVNPLTQIFPNFNTIDGAMFANKQAGIGTASEVTTGPVHAIVRANPDSNVFRFTATSAWTAGDTMTLDGNAVVVHMSDGTVPATGAYIIGAEVLAMVNANLVTLAISSNGGVTTFNTRSGNVMPEASDYTAAMIDYDNTNVTLKSTDVQGAIDELSSITDDIISSITIKQYEFNLPANSTRTITHSKDILLYTDRGGLWSEGVNNRSLSVLVASNSITLTRIDELNVSITSVSGGSTNVNIVTGGNISVA